MALEVEDWDSKDVALPDEWLTGETRDVDAMLRELGVGFFAAAGGIAIKGLEPLD
jgi:hypothetical protein